MRGIVEDVLWEGGVLTTDEIYRGVKAKHAQLGQLLPPRWQEEVRQILEAHCISHEGNSWFLEKLEPLEERPECETSLFDPHGTSERIINDLNRGQKRTDWANTESYQYLDLALPKYVAGDMVRDVLSAHVHCLVSSPACPWPTGLAAQSRPGLAATSAVAAGSIPPKRKGRPDLIVRGEVVVCKFPGSDDVKTCAPLARGNGLQWARGPTGVCQLSWCRAR